MAPGERLKKAREFLGLTQGDFGEGLGLKLFKIRDVEVGKQKLTAAIALKAQEIYAISFKWLMDEEGEMKLPVCLEENENYLALPEPFKKVIKDMQENPAIAAELHAFAQGLIRGAKKKA